MACFWSSSLGDEYLAYTVGLSSIDYIDNYGYYISNYGYDIYDDICDNHKNYGYAVRCVKD